MVFNLVQTGGRGGGGVFYMTDTSVVSDCGLMIIAEDKGFMEVFKVANLSALIVFSNPSSNTQ